MPIKIAITGPESSGKTTLAKELAKSIDGICVEEYARSYMERLTTEPVLSDLVNICQGQLALEIKAEQTGETMVCDTDFLVLKVWAEVVFGEVPDEIEQAFLSRHYDLIILCKPDLVWEPDPLRSAPSFEARESLFERYAQILDETKKSYYVVEGQGESRFNSTMKKINELF